MDSSGASDSDPVLMSCSYFFILDPVFDDSLNSYTKYDYPISSGGEDMGTSYYKNEDKEISYDEYTSNTDWILKSPCKGWNDALSKTDILNKLSN